MSKLKLKLSDVIRFVDNQPVFPLILACSVCQGVYGIKCHTSTGDEDAINDRELAQHCSLIEQGYKLCVNRFAEARKPDFAQSDWQYVSSIEICECECRHQWIGKPSYCVACGNPLSKLCEDHAKRVETERKAQQATT